MIQLLPGQCIAYAEHGASGFGKLWCSHSLEQGFEIWQTEAVEQGCACCC